jgi:GH25 family lysozyme M1 (1,4-beta-N-acetylmuramidase)
MIQGIDVASFQPETFPTTGLDFVLVKATQGRSYVNPRMARQAATARTAGLALGFYHFLQTGHVKEQAAYFVDKAVSVQGDLLVCDWETDPVSKTAPTNAEKDAFLAELARLRPGHRIGLYCNRDFWLTRDHTSKCGDFLWIADPGVKAGAPRIKAKWTIHQYAVTGGTDRNVANFASRAAMKQWAGYPVPKPAPAPAPKPAPKPVETKDQEQDRRLAALEGAVRALQQKVG